MRQAIRFLSVFYAGTIFGVSFIATPVKFLTPGFSVNELLRVGRTTYGSFAWIEAVFVVLILFAAMVSHTQRMLAMLIGALVVTQHLAIRPIMDARLQVLLDGGEVAASLWHHVYGILEVSKIVLLLIFAARCTRRGSSDSAIAGN